MFRYVERTENTARLLDAGFRIALTDPSHNDEEWVSVIATAGVLDQFNATYDTCNAEHAIDFLLRDMSNPSSVMSNVEAARNNAKTVRTALTRETWEATNECWMTVREILKEPVRQRDLPEVLRGIRQQAALVRAALHGTMLRNDIFDFCRIGTFLERADNTARILDVKYYVLLPSVSLVGSTLDNIQWDMILRSVSAQRSYRWLNNGEIHPKGIADFLILDRRMPRSLAFCFAKIVDNLGYLQHDYGQRHDCHEQATHLFEQLKTQNVDEIFEMGLHEFLEDFIANNNRLAKQIETDYRFVE